MLFDLSVAAEFLLASFVPKDTREATVDILVVIVQRVSTEPVVPLSCMGTAQLIIISCSKHVCTTGTPLLKGSSFIPQRPASSQSLPTLRGSAA